MIKNLLKIPVKFGKIYAKMLTNITTKYSKK